MSEIATENTEAEPLGSVPDAITGSDEHKIKEMVRELNKQREEQGTLARDEIKVREYHLSGPVSLKDATSKISDEHKIERAQEYANSLGIKLEDSQALEIAKEAARLGRQPSELPHSKVSVINDFGQAVPELRDDVPITRENSFETAKKATTGGLDYEYSASGGKKYGELPSAKARRPDSYLSAASFNDGLAPDEIHPDIDAIIAKTWR